MKKILLGTNNQARIRIICAALKTMAKVLVPSDLGIHLNVKEDGQSTEENANKKAWAYPAPRARL